MSVVVSTLADLVSYTNTLYEADSTPPSSGDEDYTVWTALFNIAINLWESEEGVLWNELFTSLANAANGTKTTTAGTYSYACPTLISFPASGYVWLGSGVSKTPYKVIKPEELQLYENNSGDWCYFLLDATPTLEFNPNLTISTGQTINYSLYIKATKLSASTDVIQMSDPMFAVYYALSELKKEEGDTSATSIASQKMEAMKTKNIMPSWYQSDNLLNKTEDSFGLSAFGT